MELDPDLVQSRHDFVAFVKALQRDFETNNADWSNVTLPDFLESIAAWAEDAEHASSPEAWKAAAIVLLIGRIYE